MTKQAPPDARRRAAQAWAALVTAWLFVELFIVPSLLSLLRTAGLEIGGYERTATSILSLAVLCLPLTLAMGVSFALGRTSAHPARRELASFAVVLWLALLASLADAFLYRSFGRHLLDLVAYLRQPHGAEAAGDPAFWWARLSVWALEATLATLFWWLLVRAACRVPLSAALARFTFGLGVVCSLTLASTLWFVPTSLVERIRPRLMGALAFDPSPAVPRTTHHQDPTLAALQARLEPEYEKRYAYVFGPPGDARRLVSAAPGPRPSISLVVAESFRADMMTSERMPRLWKWSEGGLRLEDHHSGANHSETGMFSLLFGRSVLTYHSTLNGKGKPGLCESLRALGYLCGYFSGHPKVWVRREEFLNPTTMDVFSHDDRGDWNAWDKGARQRASEFLAGPGPRIAITFLMSSHYEYRYPERYRRHLPDTEPRFPWASMKAAPEEFPASKNRYLNVVGYIDDLVGDHVDGLRGKDVLAVFTGDHGEMLGEDGHFGHGWGFADNYVRVPFSLVGPGIAPEVRRERTVHQDLLPSLLGLLGQAPPRNGVGRSWFAEPQRASLLLANTKHDFRTADAVLLLDGRRLSLSLDLEHAWLEVKEFQDSMGRQEPPGRVDVERFGRAFAEELDRAGSSLP